MAVCIDATTLELARGKFEEANEVIDGALELFVPDKAGEAGTDL
jgi:hypothetical protein